MNSLLTTATALDEIRDLLLGGTCDYVATAMTPWHALGVRAELRRRKLDEPGKSGVIVLKAHPKDGLIVREELFNAISGAKFVIDPNTPPEHQKLLPAALGYGQAFALRHRGARPLPIISPLYPNVQVLRIFASSDLRRRYKLELVLVDEGLATYFDSKLRRPIERVDRPNGASPLIGKMKTWAMTASRTGVALRWPVDRRFLLQQKGTSLAPDEAVAQSYRDILRPPPGQALADTDDVIVLTQPFAAYGGLSERAEAELLANVVQRIIDKGYRVGVKLHPRDQQHKYDDTLRGLSPDKWSYVSTQGTLEELLIRQRPMAVVGFTSTGLVTSPLLYGVPSFTAAEALLATNVAPWLSETAKTFRRLTRGMVAPLEEMPTVASTVVA